MSLGNMLIVGFLRKFLLSLWMDYKEVWEPNYLCVMKTTFCNIDWVSGRKEVFFFACMYVILNNCNKMVSLFY